MPGIMPKSLRALFVQLNFGKDATAVKIQTNASIGAAIPVAAPILCLTIALFSGNPFVPLQPLCLPYTLRIFVTIALFLKIDGSFQQYD